MKNAEYWKQRFILLQEAQEKESLVYLEDVDNAYRRSTQSLQNDIDRWYARVAENNEISFADTKMLLSKAELEEFKWTVEEYIKKGQQNAYTHQWEKQLENASARFHISRLEALKLQIQQHVEELYGNQIDSLDKHLRNQYSERYYRSAFEIQKGNNVGFQVDRFDERQLDTLLKKPWTTDGKTFSDRIWGNKQQLLGELGTGLVQGVIRGDSPGELISHIAKQMNVSKRRASTLVMTESAYFSSQAQKQCFNDLDVERYDIIATLDSSTSTICQKLDGKVFKMADYEPGVTAPPFHPNCRSTTAPYFDDDYGERASRNADGKTEYVQGDMRYKDWKEKMVLGKDETEYKGFVQDIGKNAPKTFDIFHNMKYNNATEYKQFQSYAKSLTSGEISALADFSLYKSISADIDSSLVGITTSNGTQITSKSNHFISRVIGSVSEKRSGVKIDAILQTLLNPEKIDSRIGKTVSSDRYFGKQVIVTVNPQTGKLIQTNPRHKKKGETK